jgi:uncharacterized protein (TIGR01619 family)
MAENWKSYLCNVNDRLASIALNLGLNEEAPIEIKPWLLWVWVYLQVPRPDGLSDRSEFNTICAIEDELVQQLAAECHAIEAGRITTQGRREFYFYGANEEKFEKAVRSAMDNFPKYKFDQGTRYEPDWNQYRSVLYPSEEEMQRIANRDVLDVLEKKGDTLAPIRDVHHWIYFKCSEDRERYADEVRKLGYAIEQKAELDQRERPLRLVIMREQSVTPQEIDESALELFRLAKEMDAEYDGWEARVVVVEN